MPRTYRESTRDCTHDVRVSQTTNVDTAAARMTYSGSTRIHLGTRWVCVATVRKSLRSDLLMLDTRESLLTPTMSDARFTGTPSGRCELNASIAGVAGVDGGMPFCKATLVPLVLLRLKQDRGYNRSAIPALGPSAR